MLSEPQVSFDCHACHTPENLFAKNGDPGLVSSTQNNVVPRQQPARKQTRQWAAWTRQEEESFFTALRQVGKNFEKITSRVQTKNKDQVRHYYYRLVRRMNKLLGPGFCLDAKNSKDTNAAMLRWWSLLEKYSCRASKLHLKPRRFKIFIEALEHQLLKDRKKSVRRRPSQSENCSSTVPITISNQSRPLGHDGRAVKLVLIDTQNIQKLGSPRGSSLKCNNINLGISRSCRRGESSTVKAGRQRRKPASAVSSAAYKKWEKAAIAGVSLVADAAEHVERTATDKGQKGFDTVEKVLPPLPSFSENIPTESNTQTPVKLKLQLFPIDEGTRRALETENHNPHLELTLSSKKRMSSVIEHLNRKWGNSSMVRGELMLFPFGLQRERIESCQRWTQESIISAGDLYAIIGSPPVFRLRYGWFSNIKKLVEPSSIDMPEEMIRPSDINSGSPGDLLGPSYSPTRILHHQIYTSDGTSNRQLEDVDDQKACHATALSAGEWADSLTNISVGDLLSEDPIEHNAKSSYGYNQTSFSCDSFDAAIADHISRHYQGNTGFQCGPSILDNEETCDAFSFQKNPVLNSSSSEACERISTSSISLIQALPEGEEPIIDLAHGDDQTDELRSDPDVLDNARKDLNGLTDIYWPDSLGPLDLDIPSCRYSTEDLILSDSLSGLNRLIASSLDAFQNCSFFGLDDKEQKQPSTVEPHQTSSNS